MLPRTPTLANTLLNTFSKPLNKIKNRNALGQSQAPSTPHARAYAEDSIAAQLFLKHLAFTFAKLSKLTNRINKCKN